MKKLLTGGCLTVLVAVGAAIAYAPEVALAQHPPAAGVVISVFADPSDFVVQLDQRGGCGSNFFHLVRADQNFKEMVSVMLTAFSADKRMTFFIARCHGDRNIISHGYASR